MTITRGRQNFDWQGAWARNTLSTVRRRTASDRLVRRASAKGYMACFELRDGDAKDVLAAAMEGTRADVLVLGARGHGLLHRTFLGSNACREVAQSSYPVWVIRFADDSKA